MLGMTNIDAVRTVLQAILIECEKNNIEAIKDIASYAITKLDEHLDEMEYENTLRSLKRE